MVLTVVNAETPEEYHSALPKPDPLCYTALNRAGAHNGAARKHSPIVLKARNPK